MPDRVLCDPDDFRFRHIIGPAVSHIGDDNAIGVGNGGYQRCSHIGKLRIGLCPLFHSMIRHGHRVSGCLPQLLRRHILLQNLFKLRKIGFRRQIAGNTPAGSAAHPIAHHTDPVAFGNAVGVLIFFSHKARIGDGPCFHHASAAPFFRSSISFRRSCPQEASISPPRLRRTVAVAPWDCNLF